MGAEQPPIASTIARGSRAVQPIEQVLHLPNHPCTLQRNLRPAATLFVCHPDSLLWLSAYHAQISCRTTLPFIEGGETLSSFLSDLVSSMLDLFDSSTLLQGGEVLSAFSSNSLSSTLCPTSRPMRAKRPNRLRNERILLHPG